MGPKPKMAVVILLLLWEGVEFSGGRFRGLWEKGGLGEASCFNSEFGRMGRGGEWRAPKGDPAMLIGKVFLIR